MGLMDYLFGTEFNPFRFKDTIIYKQDSDLQDKYNALIILNNEYPNNEELVNEMFIVKKGLDGENEIAYQLNKAHIGMYVLRDMKFKYENLTAQIDYIIITPVYTYYVECKNLVGNITVTDKGDFVREFIINGIRTKKGMYSPLRQVEAQREVVRKIWENKTSKIVKFFASNNFEYYRKVLVIAANQDTIINTTRAPKDIKSKVLRADALIRQIEHDLYKRSKYDKVSNKKEMEEEAQSYIDMSTPDKIDYYNFYKEKYCKKEVFIKNDNLKDRLIELRKNRSNEMNIPAYYVFTNEELDKLVENRPNTFEQLKESNILSPIKVKTHGEQILIELNKK